jgi:hypothetical protein
VKPAISGDGDQDGRDDGDGVLEKSDREIAADRFDGVARRSESSAARRTADGPDQGAPGAVAGTLATPLRG